MIEVQTPYDLILRIFDQIVITVQSLYKKIILNSYAVSEYLLRMVV